VIFFYSKKTCDLLYYKLYIGHALISPPLSGLARASVLHGARSEPYLWRIDRVVRLEINVASEIEIEISSIED
jgi:hypothetical protein